VSVCGGQNRRHFLTLPHQYGRVEADAIFVPIRSPDVRREAAWNTGMPYVTGK
jgi:hypothetical protein